jgi:hypothetical protein
MEQTYKLSLFCITMLIDTYIIHRSLYYGNKWLVYDILFFQFLICCHSIFYLALIWEDRELLDILHLSVLIATLFGFFIQDTGLLIFLIIFIIGVQIQWICTKKCILNSDKQNDNVNETFAQLSSTVSLLYSCYLSYRLGCIY